MCLKRTIQELLKGTLKNIKKKSKGMCKGTVKTEM